MTRRSRRTMLSAAVLALLLIVAGPHRLAHASGPEPVKIRVEVTDAGFNDEPGDFVIEVEQGALVELTFVWAHQGYVQEEHIFVLEGYKLESDKIDFHNRETTVTFVADQPGTFDFKCDLDCELHDYLQAGHLKVGRGGGGGAAASLTPTTLTVSPSSWVSVGDPITLMAVLKDASGVPVPKAELHFRVDAEFVGTRGQMKIGTARTDANGVAFLDYQPTLALQQQTITAHFEGLGIYDESEQAIVIKEVVTPPPAYTVAPPSLEPVRHWAPLALTGVLLSVWLIFGFVLYQMYGIFRARSRR